MLSLAAYPPPWRLVAAVLVGSGGASLLLTLLLVVLATDPPVTLPLLLELVGIGALLPGVGAWAIRRAGAMQAAVEPETVSLQRAGLRVDIPHAAIARLVPWFVPLPDPGLSIDLRSGRRFRYRLGFDRDPTPLLRELAGAGVETARDALRHPTIVYAAARPPRRPAGLRWAGKFGLFSLIPASILFNAHQHIAYGGILGEYYLLGAASYARTAGVYWLTVALYLVLFAAAWRAAVEAVALASAWLAPERAAMVRWLAEHAARVGYYGGTLVLLALRFYG